MDKAKFKMRDEGFICEYCGKPVKPLGYTARDHCPYCLCSKHVDVSPGDRACECHGCLKPHAVIKADSTYKIVYICDKCGCLKRNKAAQDDNLDLLLQIMSQPEDIF